MLHVHKKYKLNHGHRSYSWELRMVIGPEMFGGGGGVGSVRMDNAAAGHRSMRHGLGGKL